MTIELATVAAILAGIILAVGVYLGRHAPMVEHPPVRRTRWWYAVLGAAGVWALASFGIVSIPEEVLVWSGVFALVGPLATMLIREVFGW
ncbi:MAG: hypothetical protein HC923_01130 [Myxococcales bacterium]|nr:hypothetical protein [Myxococcales bacterium]